MVDLSPLAFYGKVNYLKRSAFCGAVDLTLPGYGLSVSKVVDHTLGDGALFEVYAELDEGGTIWNGGKVSELTDQAYLSGLGADPTYVNMRAWLTPTQLTIRLENFTSPTATGIRRVYWLIYKDYPL